MLYRLSFLPVRKVQRCVSTFIESAYTFNRGTESFSGSLVWETIIKSSLSLNLSYTCLILPCILGQSALQVVKKNSATYTLPSTSLLLNVFPFWSVNTKGCTTEIGAGRTR